MHLLHDENGNLIPHGESHCHEHTHTHTHEHTHDHDHDHHHDHCHEHCDPSEQHCGSCEHSHGEADGTDKIAALLDYMLKHNEHHAAELDQMAAKLMAEGKAEAAAQIKKAVDEFQKGNLYLSLAVATVKES